MHLKKKKEQEQNSEDKDANPYAAKRNPSSSQGSNQEPQTSDPELEEPVDDGLTRPTFNAENELSNSIGQLKGRYLYPKRKEQGGWGYANIRTSTEVNNDTGFWTDGIDNLITTINSGTPIGKVLSEKSGLYNGYSYRWFKVKLYKPIGGWFSDYTEGFVRADTVTIKAY